MPIGAVAFSHSIQAIGKFEDGSKMTMCSTSVGVSKLLVFICDLPFILCNALQTLLSKTLDNKGAHKRNEKLDYIHDYVPVFVRVCLLSYSRRSGASLQLASNVCSRVTFGQGSDELQGR
jgi:hypothetical protein